MANIRDVAKLANCSIATVSRVLSQDDSFVISNAKKQEIFDAVKKLQYVHRSAQKRIHLACILAVTSEKYSDPFFTSILSSMEEECVKQGAAISFVKNYTELENPEILNELYNSNISGIFLMERIPKEMMIDIQKNIPHIQFIDNEDADYEFDGVGFDHYSANWQVMNCLINKGYRRIAIISGSSVNEPFNQTVRMTCYREALRRNNIPFDERLVKDCNWDLEICEKQVKELMCLDNPPDVIFAGSDSLASCVLGTLYQLHYVVPDDVGVIGFNNIQLSAHMVPPLTTIDIPTKEIGIAAVQRMMEMIKGRNTKKRKILFTSELIERKSLRRK